MKYKKADLEKEKHKKERRFIIRKGPTNLCKPKFFTGSKHKMFNKKK